MTGIFVGISEETLDQGSTPDESTPSLDPPPRQQMNPHKLHLEDVNLSIKILIVQKDNCLIILVFLYYSGKWKRQEEPSTLCTLLAEMEELAQKRQSEMETNQIKVLAEMQEAPEAEQRQEERMMGMICQSCNRRWLWLQELMVRITLLVLEFPHPTAYPSYKLYPPHSASP